jgi:hypothetical protein
VRGPRQKPMLPVPKTASDRRRRLNLREGISIGMVRTGNPWRSAERQLAYAPSSKRTPKNVHGGL